MSNLQAPISKQNQTATERIVQFTQVMIAPHPAIIDLSIKGRVQLLNAISLILTISFAIGFFIQPVATGIFESALFISACSFLLGKSKYPQIGTFLFSFGFLSITYLGLYFGFTNNYSASILSIIPIVLIAASALTRQRIFAGLAIYAVVAALLTSIYSAIPVTANDTMRVVEIITFIGVALYGINAFRVSIENSRLREIHEANQNLQDIKANLEARTREHEQEINTASRQTQEQITRLRVITELSQAISANINTPPQELLAYITRIISEKTGFYHVGIFLLDKNRQYAELRAANSSGGQRMLERHHQLKIGGTGIVGYVSQSGYPRIALSTGADAVFFNNPDLPDTQSEMALPLKVGNHVIGVIDVQSPLSAAFSEEDTNMFTTLANQVALIIQNARLDNNQAAPVSSSQYMKKSGISLALAGKQNGYVYLSDGTISLAQAVNNPALDDALASGESVALPASSKNDLPVMAIPVKVRDNVIGYIHIEAAERNRKWSEDEVAMVQSVSERAALALENARLFEETERRAEQEKVMTQMTSRIGESTSFERILQTTIQEIGRTLGAKRTFIQLDAPSSSSNEEDTIADRGI